MRLAALACLAAVLVAAAWIPAFPQEPRPTEQPTIKVDVDVVNVLFSVRDRRGALVASLNKDDFTLFEDGRKQEIKYFTRESDLPLTLGLLVDVSVSQQNLIEAERRAGAQFFARILRPKDMAFLISFGHEAELLQDYTNSQKLLRSALDGLRLSAPVGGIHPGPVPTASKPRGTILYDAVSLAANEKLTGEVGRKALVLITDGVDQGSRYTREQAIEAAHKADAIIYSIYYLDPRFYGPFGGASDAALRRMSEETGGRLFRVDRRHPLEEAFDEIQREMRSQYSIGYTPTAATRDGAFRRIDIRTEQKDLKVQARRGYYAVKGGS